MCKYVSGFIFLTMYDEQLQLSPLILLCTHESYIVYLEKYAVPIRHGFSFFGHGEVMESHC